jgi:hypothetical protein
MALNGTVGMPSRATHHHIGRPAAATTRSTLGPLVIYIYARKRFLQALVLALSAQVAGSGPHILSTIASFAEAIPYSTRTTKKTSLNVEIDPEEDWTRAPSVTLTVSEKLERGNNHRHNDKKLTDHKDGNRRTPAPLNASDCP